MLKLEDLKEIIHNEGLTRKDKLLLVLSVDSETAKSTQTIREIASQAGLREVLKWNISSILATAKGLAVHLKEGWYLIDLNFVYIYL